MRDVSAKRNLPGYPATASELDVLVKETISRIADRWQMVLIEVLLEKGDCRFT